MKALKTLSTLTIVAVLSIMTGCSDQITSSGEVSTKKPGSKVEAGIPIIKQAYRVQIMLKPNRSYKFVASQSGFINFTSIDINFLTPLEDEISKGCQGLSIYGSSNKSESALSCHSSGFVEKEITIVNLSSKLVQLDVILLGTKGKTFELARIE